MKQIRPAILAFMLLTIIVGIIYPLIITGVGKTFFPYQANGSLVYKNNRLIGSELVGQQFTENKYLWSRPSATTPNAYNPMASGGSNLGPLNPQLVQLVKDRVTVFTSSNEASPANVPVDLVTASGSGLDPDISVAGAYYQIKRIATARNIRVGIVKDIIDKYTKYPIFGIWGTARVNVLMVNLALDSLGESK
ncbi:MAG: potassium-transporting ATPase subunit [Burkholderiales bacterium]|jgi:K+-transporting ATPase ATPase C chain|nr:potassium-transporting ATPase subunit [Burkholderiales bacterium]